MRILFFILSLFLVGCSQSNSSTPLQPDPNWTHGVLENGVSYHIYPNDKQPVSLRLYMHVGSINETEQQRGYAHFLEHMAFNGSTHFTSNDVVKMFEESGLSFGADINAYTSYYETVYKLDLPNDAQLDNGLKWMRDIGDGLTISALEVEKEKGVIQGEIRRNRPEHKRFADKYYDELIEGSVLEHADAVGTVESVNQATAESIREFYDYWYQPHYAEVIITGDVEVNQALKLIQTQFSDWEKTSTAPEKTPQKVDFALKDYVDTINAYETPKLTLMSSLNPVKLESREQLIDSLFDELALGIIDQRLTSVFNDSVFSVQNLFAGQVPINENQVAVYTVSFTEKDRENVEALFLGTLSSLRDYGVQERDLESAITYYKQQLEDLDYNWAQKDAVSLAEDRSWDLSTDRVSQSKQDYRASLEEFLSKVNLERINQKIETLLSDDLVVLVGVNDKATQSVSSVHVNDVKALLAKQGKKPLNASSDIAELVEPPQPGQITKQYKNEQGFYIWELSNGVEVWLEQDEKAEEHVNVIYASQGGRAALSPELFAAQEFAIPVVITSGIGGFKGSDFDAYLKRNNIHVFPFINFTHHGIDLGAKRDNLADAFKVLYNIATNINVDERQIQKTQRKTYQDLERYIATPIGQWQRAINKNSYLPHSRHYFLSAPDYTSVTEEKIRQVHKELFGKNRGNKLLIIGDLQPNDITSLLRQYVASMPLERAEKPNFQVAYNPLPESEIELPIYDEKNSLYLVRITNPNVSDTSVKTVFMDDMLQKLLFKRLNEYVREELSLDYAPDAYSVRQDQEPSTDWFIEAQVAPKDLAKIQQAIGVAIEELKEGVSQKELDTAAKQVAVSLQYLKDDAAERAWFYARYLAHGYGVGALKDVQKMVESITVDDLNQRIKASFGSSAMISKYSLTPEK